MAVFIREAIFNLKGLSCTKKELIKRT